MKLLSILLLISLTFLNAVDYPNAHYLILDDAESTIDGENIGKSDVFYKEEKGEVVIKSPGTYIVSGRITGQLEVNLEGEKDKITLILDGVKITSKSSSALVIKGGYEFYSQNGTNNTGNISLEEAQNLDFSDAGAKIIIADDSINTLTGSHTEKNDGAISSKISLVITGEEKGNGVLNIVGDAEGIEIKKHLLIEGGVINIAAQDDGINLKTDNLSVCKVKGGKININAGLGKEGSGIDSNGYIFIEGGTVFSTSKITFEMGLDNNQDLVINGGVVISMGSTMDEPCTLGKQPAMNLKFTEEIDASSNLVIKDISAKEVFNFTSSKLGFLEGAEGRNFSAVIISSPDFKMNNVYSIYVDKTMKMEVYLAEKSGIELVPIKSTSPYYKGAQKLLEDSFNKDERRPSEQQKLFTDTNELFHPHAILSNGVFVGFIGYWELSGTTYVEHLVIDSHIQGQGLGTKVLQTLTKTKKSIILEVEPPNDDISKRRITFYERSGFILLDDIEYMQPAYSKEQSPVKMNLMVYGKINDISEVISIMRKEVYLLEE